MNEGAKAGIEFLHHLPEPLRASAFVLAVTCVVIVICAAFASAVR